MATRLKLEPSNFFKYWYWLRWQVLNDLPNFMNLRRHRFTFKHKLNDSGLIGLTLSQSFVPLTGSVPQQLASDLQNLYKCSYAPEGFVELAYRTTVYLAEPLNHGKSKSPMCEEISDQKSNHLDIR